MKILIKNGTIVTSEGNNISDVLIENQKIKTVEGKIEENADKVIDAKEKYLLPGGIDPHVHMRLPTPAGFSSDDFETGSKAALFGGTTTIIDFVTPQRGQSMVEALEERKEEAKTSLVDHSFHVSPVEWNDSTENEIKECIKRGITSFKVYMAYKNAIGLEDDELLNVMKVAAKEGVIVTAHCEADDEIGELREQFAAKGKLSPKAHALSRPPALEAKAVRKAIEMAAETGCMLYIVHVSSAQSIKIIREAQKKGQKVIAETCPQYLLLDDSKYQGVFDEAAKYVMSPPLRKKEDNNILWQAIADNTINSIGTDHCPFISQQKRIGKEDFRKIPNGAGGVEHRLALLHTFGVLQDRFSLNRFVDITSTKPAKIFGLYPQKGEIAPGSDADIVIWNPKARNTISTITHHQLSDLSIYEGMQTIGAPEIVINKGKIAIEGSKLLQRDAYGVFLEREKYSFSS